ncbi:MAG: thioredoxin family protein [Burkholderiales bacterium]
MKRTVCALLFLVLSAWGGAATAQMKNPLLRPTHPEGGYVAIQGTWDLVEWQGFFQQTGGDLREAHRAVLDGIKRGVLVVFGWEGCPFTNAMKDMVFNREPIQQYYRARMRVVFVNTLSDEPITDMQGVRSTQKQFADKHFILTTPTFFFYDLDGQLQYRHSGAFRNANDFYTFGRYMADGLWDPAKLKQAVGEKLGVSFAVD